MTYYSFIPLDAADYVENFLTLEIHQWDRCHICEIPHWVCGKQTNKQTTRKHPFYDNR